MTDTTQDSTLELTPLDQDSRLGEPGSPRRDRRGQRDGAGTPGGARGVPAARRRRGVEGAHRGDGHVHRHGLRRPAGNAGHADGDDPGRWCRRVRDHSGGRRRERRRADALRHPRWCAHRRWRRSVPVDGHQRGAAGGSAHVGGRLPHAARPPVPDAARRLRGRLPRAARDQARGEDRRRRLVGRGQPRGGVDAPRPRRRSSDAEGADALHAGGGPHRVGRHLRHQRGRRLRAAQPPDRVDRALRERTRPHRPVALAVVR